MSTQRCDVAKANLLPFVTGKLEGTKEGEDFELHVKACPACRELVSDKRKALQALIAAVDGSEPGVPSPGGLKSVLTPGQSKFLLTSLVVAITLIGVSYVVRPGPALLGKKASVTSGQTPQPQPTPPTASETSTDNSSIQTELSTNSNQIQAVVPAPAENAVQPEPTTQTQKDPPNPRKRPSRLKSAQPSQPPATQTPTRVDRVEVFDEQGNKVGETVRLR